LEVVRFFLEEIVRISSSLIDLAVR
jgi:hypothetical protein